jgi:cellulose synthase/poly-beta-1,6-N-acetylglucosamine synthase-like glycosyltransferase
LYAGGNNVGLREALARGARAVLVLNNDTTVAGDFLGWLVHVLNHDPRAGAVSGAIMRQDCPELLDVAYLEIYFGNGLVRRHGVNAMPGQGFDRLRRVDAGVGSCLLFRATALEQVGLFDEDYFAYHEEVDWCFRAGQRGFAIYYQPLSRVWHHGSRSTPAEAPPALGARAPHGPQLDHPMPVPWNPVRTYLGARNTVRFVRTHATLSQRLYFSLSSLYALPLSLLAVLAGREEALLLGSWGYRDALLDLTAPPTATARRGPLRRLARLPRALFWSLPRALVQARRNGRTRQVREHLRGLIDGALRRPLPLNRLGLR